jgi:hypothetical protein
VANEEKVSTEVKTLPKEVSVIKATFRGEVAVGPNGVVLSYINPDTMELLGLDIAVTDELDAGVPPVFEEWETFRNGLQKFKKTYLVNSQSTISLLKSLKTKLDKLKEDELQEEGLSGIIKSGIEETINAKVKIDLKLDKIPYDEYTNLEDKESLKQLEEKLKERKPEELTAEEVLLYLKVQVAIDPVAGKQVTELVKGDKVLVKIIDERQIAQYLTSLLGGKEEEGELIPIPALVTRAEILPQERYKLIVKFGPGIFGETIVPQTIKLKIVAPEEVIPKQEKKFSLPPIVMTPLMLVEVILIILLVGLFMLGVVILR